MYVYLSICVFQSLYLCIAISLSVYRYPSVCVSLKLSRYLPSCIPISQSVHRYSFLVSVPLSEKGFLFFQIQLFLLPTTYTLSFFVHIFMALEKVAMLYCGNIAQWNPAVPTPSSKQRPEYSTTYSHLNSKLLFLSHQFSKPGSC